jgi:hypothetical protein
MSELLGPEAALRRALRAAAEQVDPGDDGLDRIRARVSHRRPMPLPIAWVDIALTKLSLRVPDGFWVVWDRVASEVRAVSEHFIPDRLRSERLRLGWLRPVAAMSVVAFIVAAVVSMAIEVPQLVISPAGSEATQQGNLGSQQQIGGSGRGQTQTQGSNPSGNPTPSVSGPNSSACPPKPAPRHSITGAPTPSSSPSQSASPSPSDTSPSTSASPTPTPSDSLSSAPSVSGTSPSAGGAAGTGLAAGTAGDADIALATGNNAPLATTSTRPSPSPCPSSKASPTAKVQVRPNAASAVPWAPSAALTPAELRARNG